MAQQITVVVQSGVQAPRVHQGHFTAEAQQAYLDGHELVPPGTRVEFHHVELYSDLGDMVHTAVWTRTEAGWR